LALGSADGRHHSLFIRARLTRAALLGSISAALGKVILDEESAAADPGISLDISDDTDDL